MNGWQRLWVVVSAIWVVLVLTFVLAERPSYNAYYHSRFPLSYEEDLAKSKGEFDRNAALTAVLVPAVIYALGTSVAWVVRGFRTKP